MVVVSSSQQAAPVVASVASSLVNVVNQPVVLLRLFNHHSTMVGLRPLLCMLSPAVLFSVGDEDSSAIYSSFASSNCLPSALRCF